MLRFGVGILLGRGSFPYATLLVNAVGCLLIGAALPGPGKTPLLSEPARLFLVVGFLGGFTTFSAFGHETVTLFQHSPARAALNVLANVSIGLGAVVAGRALALRVWLP